jgi:hypothetical protein
MKTHAAPEPKLPCACGGSCGACAAKSGEPHNVPPVHPPAAQSHSFANVAVVPQPRTQNTIT